MAMVGRMWLGTTAGDRRGARHALSLSARSHGEAQPSQPVAVRRATPSRAGVRAANDREAQTAKPFAGAM
jgi:hypothetical protein